MNELKQVITVTSIALRAIPNRVGASLVVVVGMASVVAVTISILAMSTGFMHTVETTGRPDRAIVLSRNAQFEFASSLSRENVLTIAAAPGIKKDLTGKPIISAESLAYTAVTKRSDGLDSSVVLRGISPEGLAVRPEIKLISGRMFRPATHELIVGKSAQIRFEGLELGSQVSLPEGDWTVTGTFESNGNEHESELIADSETVLSAMRANTFKAVTVLLDRPESFDEFKAALTANPTVAVDVMRENDYLTSDSKYLNHFLLVIAYMVGGIMGLGATFGALNTVYSAVSARSIEIATLRVFGFSAVAVAASVLAEALLLSLSGAAVGAIAAWVVFNGNLHDAGGLVFRLTVTPSLIVLGMAFSCLLGCLGGLFPAIRAARLPVATALRAV